MKFKFAVVDGERREANPGLPGKCLVCGDAMIAKCGLIRVWHWSHLVTRTCDPWWEPETEWHRNWKNQFPKDWQEFVHQSEHGEKYVADVKTKSGMVLEFQYSHLHRDEREQRENFYPKMVWIVNGRRRKQDRARFFAALGAAKIVNHEPRIVSVPSNKGALLRDWKASRVPVYFDFGDVNEPDDKPLFDARILWRLTPCGPNGTAYLSPVQKTEFLRVHLEGLPFDEMCSEFVGRAVARYLIQQAPRSPPLADFERDTARRQRTRPRF
jgi:competence protein CoiA